MWVPLLIENVENIGESMTPKYHEFDSKCVCGNPSGQNSECERCCLIERLRNAERLMERLAKHIRNTDELPVLKWGIVATDLLIEVRDHNPVRYEHYVK